MCIILKKHFLCYFLQGGYDSGFLYHCKFPPCDKNSDFKNQKDEPFDFRFLDDTEDNPVQTITFRWTEFQKPLKTISH
jgi:hypothetical protein